MFGRLLTALHILRRSPRRKPDTAAAQFDDGAEFAHFSDTMEPGDQSRSSAMRRPIAQAIAARDLRFSGGDHDDRD